MSNVYRAVIAGLVKFVCGSHKDDVSNMVDELTKHVNLVHSQIAKNHTTIADVLYYEAAALDNYLYPSDYFGDNLTPSADEKSELLRNAVVWTVVSKEMLAKT